MQVLKFGGTSVANAENISKVISIVQAAAQKDTTVVVVSALGGVTDLLLNAAALAAEGNETYKEKLVTIEQRHMDAVKQLIPVASQSQLLSLVKKSCNEIEDICSGIFLLGELTARSRDRIGSYGEWLSSQIIAAAFRAQGTAAEWKDSRELITTNSAFTHAEVDFSVTNTKIAAFFTGDYSRLFILPGFIAADKNNITTTLGRGGSDYTAAILASALQADVLEIWTDVSGMMTADPRLTGNARIIPSITYQEAMELSHFGAKVIYPPTIQPVMNKGIPVWIKNTFAPQDPGTLIESSAARNGDIVRGISSINNIALLSLEGSGMVGIPGFSKRLFEALSSEKINVILITQSSSEHSICVAVDAASAARAKQAVDAAFANEIALQKVDPLLIESDLSIVALVGESMKSHPGISGRMFSAMGRNGVNVRAIAQGSSEKNISAVIATRDVRKAINVLHEEFFETTYKQVNLFIAGTGNVGAKLIGQLQQQAAVLSQRLRLQVRVAGLSNSRHRLIKEEGIDLGKWREELEAGQPADIDQFVSEAIARNLRNSIFVDVTANEKVASVYDKLLQKSISVVACNKIAASSAYENYQRLKELAGEFNSRFLFETNVGAGLPIIGTLNDLTHSGDRVRRIDAVLSGTLNFVFNHYDGSRPFAEVVRQAQDEGYTEPDPRLDLSGTDVMRKIMILAREAGENMEMEQITNNSFLPASCNEGSVEDFYKALAKEEPHFRALYEEAKAKGCILKFVACFDQGSASVGLRHIDPAHDLYHLYGKDNIVLFYTDRYTDQPMVVKGAGAGAAVTASGVFADIIRACKL
ncbi:MAG: bifunctional aspartate kinase/homoserine dehydrogenase I [Sphingobacteriales bacterium SCN 48-20]|uniref:bifunctional aspartate kinase/homoserine dehydrogenase I n=1 Tax=Terrimonas ferruginea TaxID=249 RepID=UPI00086EEFEA|nr:bifunctional aspartate kinase/homoserine dehydrogenase I [Terrimonas ferruginea]MBN8783098.1 bifunctional aspartate kinase/homoserine dehydrogenase I [Terrimonas ferruginea]ODT91134.1 MAG: bifunctional aspartate kinase/homoserine dehydrogenase I [Sphingobacteriales bacterium SCN 48-20]OJW44273.1 MAG: bifunctional aspartate kinase/homoserine dehydrogenase I [Sphingobacteriales bacterium 48-107]